MKVCEILNQKKAVGFRVPQQLLKNLDESARRIGISRADLLRDIVATYLEFVKENSGDTTKPSVKPIEEPPAQ